MKDKTLSLLIVALLVIAAGFGIYLLRSFLRSDGDDESTFAPRFNQTDQAASQQGSQSSGELVEPDEERKAILGEFPGPDASSEIKLGYNSKLNSMAVDADTEILEVSSCYPQPFVLRVRKNTTFRVRNSDTIDHTLTVDPNHTSTIPAGREVELNITNAVGSDIGNYGYACDTISPAGVFVIID